MTFLGSALPRKPRFKLPGIPSASFNESFQGQAFKYHIHPNTDGRKFLPPQQKIFLHRSLTTFVPLRFNFTIQLAGIETALFPAPPQIHFTGLRRVQFVLGMTKFRESFGAHIAPHGFPIHPALSRDGTQRQLLSRTTPGSAAERKTNKVEDVIQTESFAAIRSD